MNSLISYIGRVFIRNGIYKLTRKSPAATIMALAVLGAVMVIVGTR